MKCEGTDTASPYQIAFMPLPNLLCVNSPGGHRSPVVDHPLAPIPTQIRVVSYAQACVGVEKPVYFYLYAGMRTFLTSGMKSSHES